VNGLVARIRSIPSWQVTLGLALLGLGFLIAAQLASERPRVRYTTQERSPLIETVHGLQSQQDDLKNSILSLRQQIQDLEGQGSGSAILVRDLNLQLQEARLEAGLIALAGPGVVFRLEDAAQPGSPTDATVTARDLRTMVEELWLAGAEAIAVNGERVLASTAIIDIGGSVLVNSAYLAPPYQITAIGPADLYARLSASRGFVEFIRVRGQAGGIRVSFAERDSVRVPAFAGTVNLTYARLDASPSPAPSGPP
jgi:uncharacterized protein YlxW (UPF0749 family)